MNKQCHSTKLKRTISLLFFTPQKMSSLGPILLHHMSGQPVLFQDLKVMDFHQLVVPPPGDSHTLLAYTHPEIALLAADHALFMVM